MPNRAHIPKAFSTDGIVASLLPCEIDENRLPVFRFAVMLLGIDVLRDDASDRLP
jgi:hypothetical protein